jgi:hypothetical protein
VPVEASAHEVEEDCLDVAGRHCLS